jgi:hypothetical protein
MQKLRIRYEFVGERENSHLHAENLILEDNDVLEFHNFDGSQVLGGLRLWAAPTRGERAVIFLSVKFWHEKPKAFTMVRFLR